MTKPVRGWDAQELLDAIRWAGDRVRYDALLEHLVEQARIASLSVSELQDLVVRNGIADAARAAVMLYKWQQLPAVEV